MTIFGWFYLMMTVISCLGTVSLIGKPGKVKVVRANYAIGYILGSSLTFWGLYVWGVRNGS